MRRLKQQIEQLGQSGSNVRLSLGSNNPLWAVIAYALAITTSALLLRYFREFGRALNIPEKTVFKCGRIAQIL